MKHNGVFLPLAIDVWGGIENYVSGNRSAMYQGKARYIPYYDSHMQRICRLLKARFARSGKFPVAAANELLWQACNRYSGNSSRSWDSAQIKGMGFVVMNRYGHPGASVCYADTNYQWRHAISSVWPYSDIQTRKVPLWERWEVEAKEAEAHRAPFVRTDESEPCRFCGAPVESYRFTKTHYEYHCRRPECRHMAWLAYRKQSNGGIDLTPAQKKTAAHKLWDQVRVLNYLNAMAKQARRNSNVRSQAS